ncbi:hypothetical protein MUK42_10667 [Musa troglodytarum]|uniref:Uncharacterized protein n=1 Tax=Musa troglodytarum TaxID=320322 RepID=A0A9E7FRG1_9LILI|nr:hypothetical protein MUK42_10667 [Musa troglodytarum]
MRGSLRGPAPKDNVGGKVENSGSGEGRKGVAVNAYAGGEKDWAQRRAISALDAVGRRPPALPSSAAAPCSSLLLLLLQAIGRKKRRRVDPSFSAAKTEVWRALRAETEGDQAFSSTHLLKG